MTTEAEYLAERQAARKASRAWFARWGHYGDRRRAANCPWPPKQAKPIGLCRCNPKCSK